MESASEQHPDDNAGVTVPPPLFYVAFLAASRLLQRIFPLPTLPTPLNRVIGLPLIVAGFLLSFSGISSFWRRGTSLVPIKPSTALVVSGPYRMTRNPMYVGLMSAYLGAASLMSAVWGLLLLPVLVGVIDRLVIRKEERYLERKFGTEYLDYRERVRRWL